MCQVIPQSPVDQKKSVAPPSVPPKMTNGHRLMSSKNLFTNEPCGPLRDHEKIPVTEHIRFKREFPILPSSPQLLNAPHATFSRKKNNEVTIQIDDAVDGGKNRDQPLTHQMRNCEYANATFCRDVPVILTDTRFRDVDNEFLQGERLHAPTGSEDNISYYSITDGCSLYAHCGSLRHQKKCPADMDCPMLNLWSHTVKEYPQAEFRGFVNHTYCPDFLEQSENRKCADTSEDIHVSNAQISRISRMDVSPYHVTDLLNNRKDEQIECWQFSPVQRELGCRSFYDRDMFRQFKDYHKMFNTSEPVYEIFDTSYGYSNKLNISKNIPMTASDPRIILCPSELPELAPAGESFIPSDTEYEDSSRDLVSRCCPCRCKAASFITWLTIILFLLSMLVYLSDVGISPESPIVWMFMILLLITVFFGIVKGCQLC